MTQSQYVIPTWAADKLAELGHVMLKLSRERLLSVHKAIRMRLKRVPENQKWFWTPEWQASEREADEAFARGDYKEFSSIEEMLAELHACV